MAYDVSWVYRIVDRYSGPLSKIKKTTDAAKKAFDKVGNSVKGMSDKMSTMQGALASLGGVMAVALPVKQAAEFEDIMLDVQKVLTFKTPDQYEKFREGIFKTSLAMGKLPKDIAAIAVEGGKLGISVGTEMTQFIDLISRVSTAFDIAESEAAAAVGSIKAKLGLTVPEVGKLMDAVNYLADNTAANSARVVEIVQRSVGTMKSIKMPPELIAGWAAFSDQLETSPELAASGLNMMVSKMMVMPGMMEKLLQDPNKTIQDFLGKFAKMPEAKRAAAIFKVFGAEAGKFVLKVTNSTELLAQTLGHVGKNGKYTGSMLKELEKKMSGTKTAFGKIQAAINFAMIQIGDAFLPIIKEFTPTIVKVVSGIRDFVKAHPGIVKIAGAIMLLVSGLTMAATIVTVMTSVISVLASPVMLIAAGVALVIAGLTYMYVKSEKVRNSFDAMIGAFQPVVDIFKELMPQLDEAGAGFEVFETVVVGVFKVIKIFIDMFMFQFKILLSGIKMVKGWFGSEEKTASFDMTKSVSAEFSKELRTQLNGEIRILTDKGAKVPFASIDHSASGDVGFNMLSMP